MLMDFKKHRVPLPNDRCACCGASLQSTQHTIWELVAITFCGCVLLAVLMLAATVAYRWMDRIDREGHSLLDGPAWHEPLDDWSL